LERFTEFRVGQPRIGVAHESMVERRGTGRHHAQDDRVGGVGVTMPPTALTQCAEVMK
jgi:hypothetical protein